MESQVSTNLAGNKCSEDCMNLGPFLAQYVLSNPFDQSHQTSVAIQPIFAQIIKIPRPKPNILRQGLRLCNTQNKNDKRRQNSPSLQSNDTISSASSIRLYNTNSKSVPTQNDLDLEEIMTQSTLNVKLEESVPAVAIKIEPDWDVDSTSTSSYSHLNGDRDIEIKSELNEEKGIGIIQHIETPIEKENKEVKSYPINYSKTRNKQVHKVTKLSMDLRKRNNRKAPYDVTKLNDSDKKGIFDTYLLNDSSDKCLKLLINEFRNIKERIDRLESLFIGKQNVIDESK